MTCGKIGARSTEIHPVTGQHNYDTGNLYRTVQVMTDVRHDQLLGSIGTNPRLLIELTP